jgi:FKBP-type peptidyl-prolyl cis-trans isomerase
MNRFFFVSFICFLISCGEKQVRPQKRPLSKSQINNLSEQMNKWDATKESDEIEQYLKQHGWVMTQTTSGLRYMLMQKGNGPQPVPGNTVKVAFKIYLLDGTLCYSASRDSAKTFVVGKDNVEAGLHEGIQLMHVGDKMRFVLPSHLAHGLTGDQKKIPPLSSVMYEIELVGIVPPAPSDKVVK